LNSGADNTAQTNENGMYQDVNVMDIDSDSTDPKMKKKNKNAKADIDLLRLPRTILLSWHHQYRVSVHFHQLALPSASVTINYKETLLKLYSV
jgi:heme-binding NEAT domain protein